VAVVAVVAVVVVSAVVVLVAALILVLAAVVVLVAALVLALAAVVELATALVLVLAAVVELALVLAPLTLPEPVLSLARRGDSSGSTVSRSGDPTAGTAIVSVCAARPSIASTSVPQLRWISALASGLVRPGALNARRICVPGCLLQPAGARPA